MFSKELVAKINAWEDRFQQWLKSEHPDDYLDVLQYVARHGDTVGWSKQVVKNRQLAKSERARYCETVEQFPFRGEIWEYIG